MTDSKEKEFEDRWCLGWRGLRIEGVARIGGQVQFDIGETSSLTLAAPFTLAEKAADIPGVKPREFDPSDGLAPEIEALAGQTIRAALGFKDGRLRVAFSSGQHLNAPRGHGHPSWMAHGETGRSWEATADGELSVYSARRTADPEE